MGGAAVRHRKPGTPDDAGGVAWPRPRGLHRRLPMLTAPGRGMTVKDINRQLNLIADGAEARTGLRGAP